MPEETNDRMTEDEELARIHGFYKDWIKDLHFYQAKLVDEKQAVAMMCYRLLKAVGDPCDPRGDEIDWDEIIKVKSEMEVWGDD